MGQVKETYLNNYPAEYEELSREFLKDMEEVYSDIEEEVQK